MAFHPPLRVAVDCVDNRIVALALTQRDGVFDVALYQHFDSTTQTTLTNVRLMTAIDHRATHYQQMASGCSHQQVHDVMQQSLATGAELTLDHQTQRQQTPAIACYQSQLEKHCHQFARLNSPITIVEPAFQAVLRASNWLLPSHWSLLPGSWPTTEWLILQLDQPLCICLYCRFGELHSLTFRSLNELVAESPTLPVFYYGKPELCATFRAATASPAIPLTLSELEQYGDPPLTAAQHLPLVGVALRRFNQWHH